MDYAFESHIKTYLDCNFCDICKTNKAALFKTYDALDFFSLKAVQTIYKVINECGWFHCF